MTAEPAASGSATAAPLDPWSDADSHAHTGFRWFVLHTRSRHEKAAAEVIAGAGGVPYLPLHRRVVFYGHRRRVVEAPVFSCYLFLWGLPEHAYVATSSKRVAQILPVVDQAALTRELGQIRRVLTADGELGPYQFLSVGRPVRVTAGPLKGVEGVVDELGKKDRLILKVHAIGRALALEIDASLLEPMD